MRPPEFTNEEVIQAGKNLQAEGRKISGFALRGCLGGGNAARLKLIWDEHLAQQVTPLLPLPPELQEVIHSAGEAYLANLTQLVSTANGIAAKLAERRVTEIQKEASIRLEEAHREVVDAVQTVEALESLRDKLRDDLSTLTERFNHLQTENQKLVVRHAEVTTELRTIRTAHQQLVGCHAAEIQRLQRAHGQALDEAHGLVYQLRTQLEALTPSAGNERLSAEPAKASTHGTVKAPRSAAKAGHKTAPRTTDDNS